MKPLHALRKITWFIVCNKVKDFIVLLRVLDDNANVIPRKLTMNKVALYEIRFFYTTLTKDTVEAKEVYCSSEGKEIVFMVVVPQNVDTSFLLVSFLDCSTYKIIISIVVLLYMKGQDTENAMVSNS